MEGEKFFFIAAVFLVLIPISLAHVEHAKPGIQEGSLLYQIFLLHDWIHPVFFLFMIYSCYYVRFFSGRKLLHEPKACLEGCSKIPTEGWLKQYHRYFFWGTLLLTFVHVGEMLPSLPLLPTIRGFDLGIFVSEGSYLAFAFLYLGTCYHFRYWVERLARKGWVSFKLYNKLTDIHRHHNLFFWLTITAVILRFILVTVDTGSIIQAIPGTF